MELRVLKNFLVICREGNMSRAAAALHLTQPTLSRQIADLERELGCELLVRGRELELTEQGVLLRRRATELEQLAEQTVDEIKTSSMVAGEVRIAAGESWGIGVLAAAMRRVRKTHPQVTFAVHSGNGEDVAWRLDRGLADFGVFMSEPHISRYNHVRLGPTDAYGLLMPEGHPLAAQEALAPEDLLGVPLLVSEGNLEAEPLASWFGELRDKLDVAGTYTLAYNAGVLVREGVGCALTFDRLVATGPGTGLEFRPLDPPAVSVIDLAWKRGTAPTAAQKAFLDELGREG